MNNFNFEILNKKLNLTREELYDARDNKRFVNVEIEDVDKCKYVLGLIMSFKETMADVYIISLNKVISIHINRIFKFKYVCIIGSMKFFESYMINIARTIQASGSIPLMPFKCPNDYNMNKQLENQFNLMIIQNIMLADEIFVVNPNNYIGESTLKEINFAKTLNKPILYMNQVEELYIPPIKVTLCGSFKFKSIFYDLNKYLTMNGILCNLPSTLFTSKQYG